MKTSFMNNRSKHLLLFLFIVNSVCAQEAQERNCPVCNEYKDSKLKISKSAIPIWSDSPEDYLKYNVDLIIQSIDIYDELEIPKWQKYSEKLHQEGKLLFGELRALTPLGRSFEYLMEDPGMQQALCLDVNLNTIKTPWMVGKGFKDTPIRLFCGNNPRFRAYLRHQVYLLSQIGVDGLMVDDFTGSPMSYGHGGCFCKYCMAGFREYLKEKYTTAELKELGIDDINTFNYRDVVLNYADDIQSMRMARKNGEIPLDKDFRYFLYKSDADLFASLKEMACHLSGRYIEMGWDNVDFRGDRAIYYDFLDSYYTECGYQKLGLALFGKLQREYSMEQKDDERLQPEIIFIYKFADATHKWFSPTPEPTSWGAVKVKDMNGILKLWTAFSYANGSNIRYPRKGWCFGPTSRWYYPPKDDFEPIYSFIRNNRELFDGYETVEQVGVLYTHAESSGAGSYFRPLKYACGQLVQLNIPFGTPVAGDQWLSNRIKADDIDRYEVMLIPEPYQTTEDQQQVIDQWKTKKAVISVKESDDLKKILKGKIAPLLSLESKSKVWLFPRYEPSNKKAPLICHVVNYDFDADKNENNLQENIRIRLSKKLLEGSEVKSIAYYTIGKAPVKMDYSIKGDKIFVDIPKLDLWGIVKVEKE